VSRSVLVPLRCLELVKCSPFTFRLSFGDFWAIDGMWLMCVYAGEESCVVSRRVGSRSRVVSWFVWLSGMAQVIWTKTCNWWIVPCGFAVTTCKVTWSYSLWLSAKLLVTWYASRCGSMSWIILLIDTITLLYLLLLCYFIKHGWENVRVTPHWIVAVII
jgi:hypothetical protein